MYLELRDYISRILIYVWFVAVGKALWRWEPAFLNYEGPSQFLEFSSMLGFYGVMTLGMMPVSMIMHSLELESERTWQGKNFAISAGLAALLVFLCMLVSFGLTLFGGLISLISEDLANLLVKYATITR